MQDIPGAAKKDHHALAVAWLTRTFEYEQDLRAVFYDDQLRDARGNTPIGVVIHQGGAFLLFLIANDETGDRLEVRLPRPNELEAMLHL
jgi:hypothetical protein